MVSPSPKEYSTVSTSTLPPPYSQAILPTSSLTSLATATTSLSAPSFQDSFKRFSFLHFPIHPVLDSSSTSLSNPPSYSDSLSSFATHTSMDRPSFSISYTLTTSLPSSSPPPYPTYRLHLYMLLLGLLTFPWGLFPICMPQFFPLTPFLYHILAVPPPGSLLPPMGLSLVVPRKGSPEVGPGTGSGAGPKTIPDLPPLVAPCSVILFFFPYFPPGPTPPAIGIIP